MLHTVPPSGRQRERHLRGRQRVGISRFIGLFLVIVMLYVAFMIWNFHQITTTTTIITTTSVQHAARHQVPLPIIKGISGPPQDLSWPSAVQHHKPAATTTRTARPRSSFQESIRVLILVASIRRIPETICATIQSVFDNFHSPGPVAAGNKSRTATSGNVKVGVGVEPPVLLVHRHGPTWNCEEQGLQHGSDRSGVTLILRQYPPHERVSNFQQIDDYLALMNDGVKLLRNNGTEEAKNQSSFSHVLFLDDDVELCPNFSSILSLIHTATVASHFTLAHLGRGGNGVLVPSSKLPKLLEKIMSDYNAARHKKQKNIDKSFLEWALQDQRGCTVRPTTIQMRHMGLKSRLHPGKLWQDVDRCGQAANNRAWQSLSENSLHPALYSEYCVYSGECSPYSSKNGRKDVSPSGINRHSNGDNMECHCVPGFTGRDCGIRTAASSTTQNIRRNLNAPIVVLLSSTSIAEYDAGITRYEDLQRQVVADSRAHHLVNLYVLGNSPRTEWLADNIYASTSDASHAFELELRNSSRFGAMAFPIELITLDSLLSPQELWTLKYYVAQDIR